MLGRFFQFLAILQFIAAAYILFNWTKTSTIRKVGAFIGVLFGLMFWTAGSRLENCQML
jgi:hypothetical protein